MIDTLPEGVDTVPGQSVGLEFGDMFKQVVLPQFHDQGVNIRVHIIIGEAYGCFLSNISTGITPVSPTGWLSFRVIERCGSLTVVEARR